MKAIVVRQLGGPEVLQLEQAPEPAPGPGEVGIAVQFIGVNYTDVRNRIGDGLGVLPFTPGVEVSGTVCSLGPGAHAFEIGQQVAAFTRGHAYAERVTAAEAYTVALPPSLVGKPQSAGMLVTVPIAVNVVERAARIRPGEAVLLHAAAGGVGSVVGQLLGRLDGVRLFGTVGSPEKADYARRHGYAEVWGYDDFDARITELTRGVGIDVVLDPIGGDVQRRSLEMLAPFGRLVSYSNISRAAQELPDAEWMRARCVGFLGVSNGWLSSRRPEFAREGLRRATAMVASGEVEIDVTAVLPLSQAAQAHRQFSERRAVGKFILEV